MSRTMRSRARTRTSSRSPTAQTSTKVAPAQSSAGTSRSSSGGTGGLIMTRLRFVLSAILGLASIMLPAPIAAQDAAVQVTGAGEATFPNGASFNGVPLRGLTLGQGLVIAQDRSARGQFQVVLLGTSFLGVPQEVIVEGEVRDGSSTEDGSVTFSGTATLDMGNGTLPM